MLSLPLMSTRKTQKHMTIAAEGTTLDTSVDGRFTKAGTPLAIRATTARFGQ